MKGRSLLYRPYEAAPEIIEREREISDVVAVMDRPLGKDVIAEAMMKFRELADKHASLAAAAVDPEVGEAHERKSTRYLERMADCAHKLAPFESPRFAAIDYALRDAGQEFVKFVKLIVRELRKVPSFRL